MTAVRYVDGVPLQYNPRDMRDLGRSLAEMHEVGADWHRLERQFGQRQDFNAYISALQHAPGWFDKDAGELYESIATDVLEVLRAVPQSLRWGACHGDVKLDNARRQHDRVMLFDLDHAGWYPYAYDLACVKIAVGTQPAQVADALFASFLLGYREMRDLGSAEVAAIDTLIGLREWRYMHLMLRLCEVEGQYWVSGERLKWHQRRIHAAAQAARTQE